MKITPNHIDLILINWAGETIHAKRVSENAWHMTKEGEDRKDGISEDMLQQYIDEGRLRVKQFQMDRIDVPLLIEAGMVMPLWTLVIRDDETVGLRFDALTTEREARAQADKELSAAIERLSTGEFLLVGDKFTIRGDRRYFIEGAKNEVVDRTPMLMRAGPEGIPLDMIESAQEITVMAAEGKHPIYFGRESLDDMFAYSAKPLPKDTFILNRANNRHVAEMTADREFTVKQFPQREFYDHLSVRYGDLCKQVAHSSQTVTALERDLGAARDLYNKQCDEREALYARMVALGQ